ncbi:MAG: glycosyltransferase family 2 protein [Bacteroidota bacterium]
MCDRPRLSIVLPAYNEEGNIRRTIEEILSFLPGFAPIGRDFEIIAVDDGSRDQTGRIVQELSAVHPEVRLVQHEVNRGYGGALRSGFAAARGEFIFFMDSDGQFVFPEIEKLLAKIEQYDAVLGYRLDRQDSFMRKLNAFGWNTLTKLLFGLSVRDIDCAFKLYRRELIADMPLSSGGALINAEMLARAKRKGFRFAQVGVTHRPRIAGKQTGANLRVIIKAFAELFRLYSRIKRGE